MVRWTQTIQDQQHIAKVNEQMPIGGIAVITLLDGTRVEGVLRSMNTGNNAGRGGWSYYAECEVEDKSKKRWVIDYLDIKSAERIWNENIAAEYEELGLITIVRQPV